MTSEEQAAEIARLRFGYKRIAESSDLEMQDGDLARKIAEEMLAGPGSALDQQAIVVSILRKAGFRGAISISGDRGEPIKIVISPTGACGVERA